MCFEWYEESLLDAQIWKSAQQAEERMKQMKFSSPHGQPEPIAEAQEEHRSEPRQALVA